jgi:hypothetical protein
MSHTVTRKAGLTHMDALRRAVSKIPGASVIGTGKHQQFSESIVGVGVKLPDYYYPVVIDTQGSIHADTYGGRWGNPELQDKLAQNYGVAVAELEAERLGGTFTSVTLPDGAIKCTITLGDSPASAPGGFNVSLGPTL